MIDLKTLDVVSEEFERVNEEDSLSSVMGKIGLNKTLIVFNNSDEYLGVVSIKQLSRSKIESNGLKLRNVAVRAPKLRSEDSVVDSVRLMLSSGCSQLPVFRNGTLMGVMTYDKLLKKIADSDLGKEQVEHYYSPDPFIVNGSDSIGKVLTLLRNHNISFSNSTLWELKAG